MKYVLAISILFFVQWAFGHSHSPSDDLKDIENLIGHMVIKVEKSPSLDAITFVGPNGNKIYIERGEIARAVSAAVSAYYGEKAGKGHHHHHHHGPEKNSKAELAKKYIRGLQEMVVGAVEQLPSQMAIGSSEAIRMAKSLGVLPSIFLVTVFTTSYIPYTIVTESFEALFLGPFHVFCHFFQLVYFYYYGLFTMQIAEFSRIFKSISLAAKYSQSKRQALFQGLKALLEVRRNRQAVKRALVHASTKLESDFRVLFRQADAYKIKPPHGLVEEVLQNSRFWLDRYFAQRGQQGGAYQSHGQFDYWQSQAEELNTLRFILGLASLRFNLLYKVGEISYGRLVQLKSRIGEIGKELEEVELRMQVMKVVESQESLAKRQTQKSIEKLRGLVMGALKFKFQVQNIPAKEEPHRHHGSHVQARSCKSAFRL